MLDCHPIRRLAAALLVISAMGGCGTAAAEFRFSSQSSLLAPDPFVKPKPRRPAPGEHTGSITAPAKSLAGAASEDGRSVADIRLAAFPGHMPVDAVARLTLDAVTLKLIRQIEIHFAQRAEIVSGCRTHEHNIEVGGTRYSYHLSCLAADIRIPGVKPEEIRDFALSLPSRGGVGTYCGLDIVHVDAGTKREWHRPCGLLVWHGPDDTALTMR
jgi:hypothetical protein